MSVDDTALASVQAGAAALAKGDWAPAYDQLEDARRGGALDAAGFEALAEAAFAMGLIDESFDARERAYTLYDEAGDVERAGGCAVWLTFGYFATGRPAIGGGWHRRAQHCLEGREDCAPFGHLLVFQSYGAAGSGDVDAATALATAAVEVGRKLRDADVEAMALQALATLQIAAGNVIDGLALLDESMLFAIEGRLTPFALGSAYCTMIATCEDVGDVRRAAEWTEALSRWTADHPFAVFPGICRVHRATVLQRRGAWPGLRRRPGVRRWTWKPCGCTRPRRRRSPRSATSGGVSATAPAPKPRSGRPRSWAGSRRPASPCSGSPRDESTPRPPSSNRPSPRGMAAR